METPVQPPNSTKVATKWAVIYTLTSIIITYAMQLTNTSPDSPVKYLSYIPFIGFLLLAQKEFRDELGGYMSFGNGFSAGFRYAVFAGLMLGVFTYIYFAILSPAVWNQIVEVSRAKIQETNKNLTDEQVDKAIDITRKYGPVFGGFGAAIGSAVSGAVFSLIGAAIFKKERSPYDIAENAIDPNENNS